ncbi:MAG TPA: alpha/beta fold hydrolase [Polyangia bacterium]
MKRNHYIVLVLVTLGGCSKAPASAPADGGIAAVTLAVPCSDAIADVYTAPADLPPYDESHRGDIVRCAFDRAIGPAELSQQAVALGYQGPPLTSGANVFRVAYRTERIAPAAGGAAPGALSSALLLVPSAPHGAGALAVYSHPSVGVAPPCAPSQQDLMAPSSAWDPVRVPLLALAGAGWTVIAPDNAGFGFGDAPGWSVAADEAHSLLDSTRAARQLLPDPLFPSSVVIIGHSQGGHGALSAHALAPSYGVSGTLVGVAALAPLWISSFAWSAALSPAAGMDTSKNGYFMEYQLDYFYSHGELYDGAGGGLAMIQAAKRDQVKSLVETQCLDDFAAMLPAVGHTTADIYDSNFITTLGNCGLGFNDCSDATSATWKPRLLADRPPLAAGGPPVVLWYGGQDQTITPGYARCELDKIAADGAAGPSVKACVDSQATHTGIVGLDIGWVSQWIAARATGDAEPSDCAAPDATIVCTTPPQNL